MVKMGLRKYFFEKGRAEATSNCSYYIVKFSDFSSNDVYYKTERELDKLRQSYRDRGDDPSKVRFSGISFATYLKNTGHQMFSNSAVDARLWEIDGEKYFGVICGHPKINPGEGPSISYELFKINDDDYNMLNQFFIENGYFGHNSPTEDKSKMAVYMAVAQELENVARALHGIDDQREFKKFKKMSEKYLNKANELIGDPFDGSV